MSRNNKLGESRRSQVLTYGPGAIVDFRSGGQGGGPVSVVAPGLEFWDEYAKPRFPLTKQKINEPRLQKKLKVKGFRLPPVDIDSGNWQNQKEKRKVELPGFRFPRWLQCPVCYTIKDAGRWGREDGDPSRWCNKCSSAKGRRIHVVPARFVVACARGHLDEFPWLYWLKMIPENQKLCQGDRECSLKLESKGGTGLSSLHLVCKCSAKRNMGTIFSKDALGNYHCKGHMPWLEANSETCGEELKVLNRGASNLYFPVEDSALSIPPWSDAFHAALEVDWDTLAGADEDQLESLVKLLYKNLEDDFNMSVEDICDEIIRRKKYLANPETEDLKYDELCSFTGEPLYEYTSHHFDDSDFRKTEQKVPEGLSEFVSRSVRVDRLKEVRALKGFTRINQAASFFEEGISGFGKITSNPNIKWLPAIEVRGEGIFFNLEDSVLDSWCKQKEVVRRAQRIDNAYKMVAENRENILGKGDEVRPITSKFLLLHTLSHIIMRHISLECGYDTASIRERIYCDEGEKSNNGILLYTASSDAEGTLGGLARMSEEDKFLPLVRGAIAKASWCSSDPLCIQGIVSESEIYNLSACHNCALVPEISCEFFNRFLDRSLLVGSPDVNFKGFFEVFLED